MKKSQEFGFLNNFYKLKNHAKYSIFFFKNAGVVLMTNNFVSDGREGEFAENKAVGILCHGLILTDARHGHLILKVAR